MKTTERKEKWGRKVSINASIYNEIASEKGISHRKTRVVLGFARGRFLRNFPLRTKAQCHTNVHHIPPNYASTVVSKKLLAHMHLLLRDKICRWQVVKFLP